MGGGAPPLWGYVCTQSCSVDSSWRQSWREMVDEILFIFHVYLLQIAISPEEAEELENVQNWVELMADFEQSEGEHLIAMAMKYADKKRLQDLKHR